MDRVSRRDALLGMAATQAAMGAAPKGAELCALSALEMRALVGAKKISAREILAAHLEQIERLNPKLNAIVTLAAERAQKAAQAADEQQAQKRALGALHGLPIAHKDLVNTKGMRTTYGSPIYKDFVPENDDLLVERCRSAGAILLGKTNTPEFGAGSQTFNNVFGATKNPYDLSKTCGGSSGGAAVALAARMLPIADGSDHGGSLRNPAAFCNVVGFRSSTGRVPTPGYFANAVQGAMARSVGDLALLLSAIAGPHPLAPLSLPEAGSVFREPLGRSFKNTRIAFFRDLNGCPFDPRVRSVIEGQRKTFEALGCIVEEAEPDFSGADFAFKTLRAWNSAGVHGDRIQTQRALYKDTLLREIEEGQKLSGADVFQAERLHYQVFAKFQKFLTQYDYFVLPTTQVPPFDLDRPYPTEINGVRLDNYIDWMKSCWYITVTNHPAISVPAGFTPEGLPVGMQIVGRYRQDWAVLQMAHAFEEATQVARRAPVV